MLSTRVRIHFLSFLYGQHRLVMAIDECLIGDRTFNPLPAMEEERFYGECVPNHRHSAVRPDEW